MPEFSETTPPPLLYSPHSSDLDRSSTRETTPIGTPVAFAIPNSTTSAARKPDRDRDLYFSWNRRPNEENTKPPLEADSNALESDLEDSAFPLFPSSPPDHNMDNQTPPINISASRHTSVSPPGQQASNLTSALQQAGPGGRSGSISNANGASMAAALKANAARKDSIGAMSQFGNGTKPITMVGSNRDRQRRESLAGSLVGGMSWGGVSVGSWIRDDIIMTGTSPFTLQSPSYHSSSYLPKLEANFMRDFSCCGITLPSLHDLLQHYEEAHAQKPSQLPQQRPSQSGQGSSTPGGPRNQVQPNQQASTAGQNRGFSSPRPGESQHGTPQPPSSQPQPQTQRGGFTAQTSDLTDLDTVEDMEMDDAMGETDFPDTHPKGPMQSRFAQHNHGNGMPHLNLGMLQGQALRNSQPGTPVTPGHPLSNNPTVSSVNTPTLTSNPLQQQSARFRGTPDSSTPGTPAELDESIIGEFGDMSVNNPLMGNQFSGFGGGNDMLNLCIDEPAKRLFSPTGGFSNSQQNAIFRLGTSQYGPNSQIAQRIREQQMLAGVPDTTGNLFPNEEPKPFRCPVIGCEKAYKNQNGLKYHKSHGHNNQQLHDNADGTFSIVNPETSTPYPGTMGMEKEKPYRCEVCGKRYKNLNGLKYHRSHSPPCNPELQIGAARNLGAGGVLQGQNVNVAGAGLPGIGEEGL